MPSAVLSRQQRRAQQRFARKAERKSKLAHGALAVGALLAAGSASAATFTVTNLNDAGAGSLRDAVSQANGAAGADTVAFQSGLTGTITLTTGEIPITDSVTINGPGAGVITVSGNNSSAIFNIENIASTTPTSVNINNLTLTAGNNPSGGAVRDVGENLTLDHVTISASAGTQGGGVFFGGADAATLTITTSTISGNTATNAGGGLYEGGSGAVSISSSTISNNTAGGGGGIFMVDQDAAASITGSTISGNTAQAGGGIAAVYGDGHLSMTDTKIQNNTASSYYGGGLLLIRMYNTVSLTSDTISGNKAGLSGAGISDFLYTGYTLEIANTLISGNTAGTVTGTPGYGGGIDIVGIGEGATPPVANISDSIITGNVADPADAATTAGATSSDAGGGGGIYFSYASVTVKRTTINGNIAHHGAGIYQYDGELVLENATIVQNQAESTVATGPFGGGLYAYYGTAAIRDTTITNNSATVGTGGIATYADTMTLDNSIVANNTGDATAPDINSDGGSSITPNYTLIETPGSATLLPGTGNITGSDPNLGTPAVNSSTIVAGATGTTQTPLTEMPLCPSPVINAGDPAFAPPPSTDERGKPRVAGGRIDMGAVEVQPSTLQFTTNAQSVNEGAGSVTVTASRSGSADGPVAVSYATANGTATAPADYAAASGTLSWADGDTANKSFNVTIVNDALFEAAETFTATLSAPTCQATLGANATETITIVDNDAAPALSINSVAQAEGNGGTTAFNFVVTLSPASGQTATVNYATSNGTATAPGDYASAGGTLTFLPGETSKPVTVNVVGDTACEPDETFTVNLSSPANATIANGTGSGTIQNDDPCPSDLGIVKTAGAGPYFVGQTVTYTLAVSNAGPNSAAAVTVTDTIPANSTFAGATPSQGTCSGTSTVTCSLGTIANGGSATIALQVTPTAPGPLSNTANVSAGAQSDPNLTNNSSTAAVTVAPAAAIPTLGEWAEIALAAMLALLGFFKIKK